MNMQIFIKKRLFYDYKDFILSGSNYLRAYSDPNLSRIRGDLRTPNGSVVIAPNVTPFEAYQALIGDQINS